MLFDFYTINSMLDSFPTPTTTPVLQHMFNITCVLVAVAWKKLTTPCRYIYVFINQFQNASIKTVLANLKFKIKSLDIWIKYVSWFTFFDIQNNFDIAFEQSILQIKLFCSKSSSLKCRKSIINARILCVLIKRLSHTLNILSRCFERTFVWRLLIKWYKKFCCCKK